MHVASGSGDFPPTRSGSFSTLIPPYGLVILRGFFCGL